MGAAAVAGMAQAQVAYTSAGNAYSQNFDTLASSGTSHQWSNNSTLAGWFLYRQPAPGTAITTYDAATGTATSGTFKSYGASGSTERALGGVGAGSAYFGSPASGAVAGWIAVAFNNATGGTLNSFTVSYDGEQWRNSGNASAHTMRFEYGFGDPFTNVTAWTAPGGSFDWASTVTGSPAGALDGNFTGLVAGRGGTLSGLSWAAGETLWLRWVEVNDTGDDHGLAIDNFSFTATAVGAAVPEPAEYAWAAGLALVGFSLWRRRDRR
jgi:hypothetical protein